MKVLLVEDSKFLRVATERALIQAGYEVSSAGDGELGLRLAREQLPSLILLDMMLPKVSGPQLLQALKQDPRTAGIPVIVLSSLPQSNEAKLKSEGAAAYFEKAKLGIEAGSNGLIRAIQDVLKENKLLGEVH